jgi:type IV secretion system protein TrbL
MAYAAGMMDTLVSQVQSASGGWMSTALGYATNLFFGLAALEFAWSAIQLTLKKSELSEIMVGTLFKVMSLSFFAMVLIKAPEWIPAIINSFKVAGAGVGGSSVLSPSAVFDQGLQVAASLMQFSNDAAPSTGSMIINTLTNSGQGLGKFMLSAIIVGVASVFIILGYGLIAVQLLITLVESYLIIGGGALMLGFSGSRWTHNLSEKYFGYAISVGVKLFTIYLIIGFGDSFTQALKDTIAAAYGAHPEGPSFGDYLGVGGASLFYGVTGYMAPGLAGSMLNGTVAMSLQSAGTAAGMVGGAPVAAALASSAAGARALGLAGGAIGALLPLQRAAGAIGGSSAGVGFAGGIGGAVSPVSPGSSVNPGSPGHPFWSASAPSKPERAGSASITSNANSEGTSRATSMASPRSPDLSIAASPTRPSDGTLAPDAVPGSPGATPSSSLRQREGPSMNASHASNASRPTMGQAPGFVDPRFDPSAMQGSGVKQSTNETGGTSADTFEARSFQQRFEADYTTKPGGMADKFNSFSKRLQHAADRRKPHWVNDGHLGHAPGLRMGLDA